MATLNELLRQPGPFTEAFLPTFQELVRLRNPYINYEIARLINLKMKYWGDDEIRPEDFNSNPDRTGQIYKEFKSGLKRTSVYPAGAGFNRQWAETDIVKNFSYKLASFSMSATNAWLNFQKMVDVFYKMVDVSFFNNYYDFECRLCPPGALNNYVVEMGTFVIPRKRSDATGFEIYTQRYGSGAVAQQETVAFAADTTLKCYDKNGNEIPCNTFIKEKGGSVPPPGPDLNEKYFVFNEDLATDTWTAFWYNYAGTGSQPTFTGGSVVNYVEIGLDPDDETYEQIQGKTDAAVVGTGKWTKALDTSIKCYDKPPCDPGPCDPPRKEIPCPIKVRSSYVAVSVGARALAQDGDSGYLINETDMFASDGTLIASNVNTPKEWVDTHNNVRRAYEMNELGRNVNYLKLVDELELLPALRPEEGDSDDVPYCDDDGNTQICKTRFIIVQTPWEGDINKIPVNVPGVLNDNRNKRFQKQGVYK